MTLRDQSDSARLGAWIVQLVDDAKTKGHVAVLTTWKGEGPGELQGSCNLTARLAWLRAHPDE